MTAINEESRLAGHAVGLMVGYPTIKGGLKVDPYWPMLKELSSQLDSGQSGIYSVAYVHLLEECARSLRDFLVQIKKSQLRTAEATLAALDKTGREAKP